MIKETLLFLWIFIVPILAWGVRLFFSKKEEQKINSSQKKFMKFFLYMEILFYVVGFPMVISICKNPQEALHIFCMFQIIALDIWFLSTIGPKFVGKIFSHIELDNLSGFKLFIFTILNGILFLFSCVTIPVLLAFFRLISLWDIFMEQKVPFVFILFILLFNPIFMFYQMKERLSKDG